MTTLVTRLLDHLGKYEAVYKFLVFPTVGIVTLLGSLYVLLAIASRVS